MFIGLVCLHLVLEYLEEGQVYTSTSPPTTDNELSTSSFPQPHLSCPLPFHYYPFSVLKIHVTLRERGTVVVRKARGKKLAKN